MITMVTILSIISSVLGILISQHSLKTLNPALLKKINKKMSSIKLIKSRTELQKATISITYKKLEKDELPCVCFLSGAIPSSNDKCYVLENSRVCFGRVQSCDFVVDDRSISRIHFEIEIADGIAKIKDCQSTNGTFLNGKRIEDEAILLSGDIIKIGDTSLMYKGTK